MNKLKDIWSIAWRFPFKILASILVILLIPLIVIINLNWKVGKEVWDYFF